MKSIIIIFSILSLMTISAETKANSAFNALFPLEMNGWEALISEDGVYTANNLFEYINGGAEVYIAHKVEQVYARRFEKQNNPDIIIDIFEMANSADAYGVYHHDNREGEDIGIGSESELSENTLFFRKNRYFIAILAYEDSEDAVKTMIDLAEFIAGKISPSEEAIPLYHLIPGELRLVFPPKYFHHQHCLRTHYFIADENILKLSEDVDALLAQFKCEEFPNSKSSVLIIIEYPSSEKAEKAGDNFKKSYLDYADTAGCAQMADSSWVGSMVTDKYFIGIFDSPSKNQILKNLETIKKNINIR